MKIGISASTDVQATVDRCRQLGVERVYINCASLPGYQEKGYPNPANLQELKGRLEEHGLEVPSVHDWFARWPSRTWEREGSAHPDILLNRDRRCIDAIMRMIEIVGEAGITSVLYHIDMGKPTDASQAEACWEGLIDIYRELIPVAESYGIGIGNHSLHRLLPDGLREQAIADGVRLEDYGNYTAHGWGGPFLVGTWEDLRRLVRAVPSPCNGVTLCTGMDMAGGDVPALVKEFGGKIHFCQFRDHAERWPAGRSVPPGEGRVNFSAIVAALGDVGYQGIVHVEALGKPRYPGEDLEAKAVAYINALLCANQPPRHEASGPMLAER